MSRIGAHTKPETHILTCQAAQIETARGIAQALSDKPALAGQRVAAAGNDRVIVAVVSE